MTQDQFKVWRDYRFNEHERADFLKACAKALGVVSNTIANNSNDRLGHEAISRSLFRRIAMFELDRLLSKDGRADIANIKYSISIIKSYLITL